MWLTNSKPDYLHETGLVMCIAMLDHCRRNAPQHVGSRTLNEFWLVANIGKRPDVCLGAGHSLRSIQILPQACCALQHGQPGAKLTHKSLPETTLTQKPLMGEGPIAGSFLEDVSCPDPPGAMRADMQRVLGQMGAAAAGGAHRIHVRTKTVKESQAIPRDMEGWPGCEIQKLKRKRADAQA